MPPPEANADPANRGSGRFATTHWSIVLAAREGDGPRAQAALAVLCQAYWYPLYAFIRHRGHPAEQAEDLTQGFFARLLEKDGLASVDPGRGRFRSFLLAACQHFLANEHDRARAAKRGGGRRFVSIDFREADDRFSREPAHGETPERLFERRWTVALLDRVMARLRAEYEGRGKGKVFDHLKGHLARAGEGPLGEAAEALGMTPGAAKVAVHRLRQRYRVLLRDEIAQTVADPGQVEEEIRDLFAALA